MKTGNVKLTQKTTGVTSILLQKCKNNLFFFGECAICIQLLSRAFYYVTVCSKYHVGIYFIRGHSHSESERGEKKTTNS